MWYHTSTEQRLAGIAVLMMAAAGFGLAPYEPGIGTALLYVAFACAAWWVIVNIKAIKVINTFTTGRAVVVLVAAAAPAMVVISWFSW